MNIKMATNSQISTTESKKTKIKTNQANNRTGTESQKWRSHKGLSVGRGRGKTGRKGIGNKKHNM